jgi:hypothetical protein
MPTIRQMMRQDFTVSPRKKVTNVEMLTFNFETVDNEKTRLTVAWADVKIGFDIGFDSHKNILNKLKSRCKLEPPLSVELTTS